MEIHKTAVLGGTAENLRSSSTKPPSHIFGCVTTML
jgi:hypothetical protein